MKWTLTAAAALLCLGPVVAGAQAPPTPSATTPTSTNAETAPGASAAAASLSGADKQFLDKATIAGMAEIKAGQLAQNQGGNDAVKQMGGHLASDHQAADAKLQAIADADGVQRPAALDATSEHQLAALDKLYGAQFDRTYVKEQVKAHHEAIALFKKEASSGKNGQLKQFASDTLPTLEGHLQSLEQLGGTS